MNYKKIMIDSVNEVMNKSAKLFDISIDGDNSILEDDEHVYSALVTFKPKQLDCYEFTVKDWHESISMTIDKMDKHNEVLIANGDGDELSLSRENIYFCLFWAAMDADYCPASDRLSTLYSDND